MSLTAHPSVVLAELQWKQDSLGGANRAPHHARAERAHGGTGRPARTHRGLLRLRAVLPFHGRHTARPV